MKIWVFFQQKKKKKTRTLVEAKMLVDKDHQDFKTSNARYGDREEKTN